MKKDLDYKNIIFDVRNFGHSGWTKLYNDEKIIRWMLTKSLNKGKYDGKSKF